MHSKGFPRLVAEATGNDDAHIYLTYLPHILDARKMHLSRTSLREQTKLLELLQILE